MTLEDSVVDQAWARSGGRCECTYSDHGHSKRCGRELLRERRGADPSYRWEAHIKVTNGDDTLSNCEILCHECFKKMRAKRTLDKLFIL